MLRLGWYFFTYFQFQRHFYVRVRTHCRILTTEMIPVRATNKLEVLFLPLAITLCGAFPRPASVQLSEDVLA